MGFTKKNIELILNQTLDELYEKDSEIIFEFYDLHERSITHRFAVYLEVHFKDFGYNVDVEYNRMVNIHGQDVIGNEIGKRLNLEKYGKKRNSVYPDIIVHKRKSNDNLLEIEFKMAWKNSKKEYDLKKINEYMRQLDYQYGVYIELDEKRNNCKVEFGLFNI
jgi:hypothetical protein